MWAENKKAPTEKNEVETVNVGPHERLKLIALRKTSKSDRFETQFESVFLILIFLNRRFKLKR